MSNTSSDQAPNPDTSQGASDDIEVGQAGRDLRYWLAKEAMRQGEARLNAQNAVRTALEARATAITGWAAVGFLAVAGASFTAARNGAGFWGAVMAAGLLFVAGALGIIAARPRDWSLSGYAPNYVVEVGSRYTTELEVVESLNGGLIDGMTINNRRLRQMGRLLRWAGWLLLLAPIAGATTFYAHITWITG